ncbi:VOC family protein [Rossellomorea marisflavi]|uniref:VOC family protein n=1 Tax=Rossellomorea marisflavi TaxID=189381 RepID=A0A5D4RNK4_9BACI|nr:VOC family protein [Rossellomorea marisflavi]TYS53025.1 VOC family protein [Rossellomorea marisflavi]WJV19778.1 VOC family protein [Rossellomorea marisflavi]VXC40120.1 Glyoxalase [Bacillus sp. 349Y]
MSINIYLNFNGNCREAVLFYADVFRTEPPHIMTFKEAPPSPDFPLPEEAKELILHANIVIDGEKIMFSDTFPGTPFMEGNNITLAIVKDNKDVLTALFDRLKEDGHVDMPLQETFWSPLYGQVTDKFGIQWQFNYEE